jgi:hypothetical protein
MLKIMQLTFADLVENSVEKCTAYSCGKSAALTCRFNTVNAEIIAQQDLESLPAVGLLY